MTGFAETASVGCSIIKKQQSFPDKFKVIISGYSSYAVLARQQLK